MRVSLLAPPSMVSIPMPPLMVSVPALPTITSLPAEPVRASLLPPPSIKTIPVRVTLVKFNTSLFGEPKMVTPANPLLLMFSTVEIDRNPITVPLDAARMASTPAPPVTASKPSLAPLKVMMSLPPAVEMVSSPASPETMSS